MSLIEVVSSVSMDKSIAQDVPTGHIFDCMALLRRKKRYMMLGLSKCKTVVD